MKADTYDFPFDENGIRQAHHTYTHQAMAQYLQDPIIDRGLGCLFGAFIGDSLGAYLEFAKEKDYDDMMLKAMDMPGGGVFNVKPGQITDDSQLAFHLLKALQGFNPQGQFDSSYNNLLITISNEYLNWFQSRPFDIGITCRKGLAEIATLFYQEKVKRQTDQFVYGPENAQLLVNKILHCVQAVSLNSQSNGSLMRIAPLPFYFSLLTQPREDRWLKKEIGLSQEGLIGFIRRETSILHPNSVVVDVTSIWVRMLLGMIKRRDDNKLKEMYEDLKKELEGQRIGWGKFLTNTYPINAKRENIGWSKIAIGLGFQTLQQITKHSHITLNEHTYKTHMKVVLSRGGDTDTNAAIVGGMLGAIIGFKKLPKQYLKKMMEVRFDTNPKVVRRENRPPFYEPRIAFANAFSLIRKWRSKANL